MRVIIGVNWRIRLSDPCAAAMMLFYAKLLWALVRCLVTAQHNDTLQVIHSILFTLVYKKLTDRN